MPSGALRPRVRLVMDRAQARDGDVGVKLGGGQAAVAQQLLDDAQIRPALEQVGGGAVAQAVRPDVGSAGNRRHGLVHHGAGLSRVESAPTRPQQ